MRNARRRVYDCFADALFQDLTPSVPDAAGPRFFIDVYVFNAAAYEEPRERRRRPGRGRGRQLRRRGAGACDPPFTWTTECSATQQTNIEVVALCGPLVTSEATSILRLATSSFEGSTADGAPAPFACGADYDAVRAAVRGLAPPLADAGTDASDDDAGATDAGASNGDGGLDGGDDGGLDDDAGEPPPAPIPHAPQGARTASCPDPIDFEVPALTEHVVDVELLAGGAVVARTTCYATATPRIQTAAVWDPIRRE